MSDYLTITPENVREVPLACIIRKKPGHPGIEAKRAWLAERLAEGHVFRKLRDPASCAFIEYAPLETAWVPVEGKNYLYIYCLWVAGDAKGHGHGARLMESCIEEARRLGKSGVCMLGADKQKAWLSDQAFAAKYGFRPVDTAPGGYTLLALSLDVTTPISRRGRSAARSMRAGSLFTMTTSARSSRRGWRRSAPIVKKRGFKPSSATSGRSPRRKHSRRSLITSPCSGTGNS